jgi:hypothetical protein
VVPLVVLEMCHREKLLGFTFVVDTLENLRGAFAVVVAPFDHGSRYGGLGYATCLDLQPRGGVDLGIPLCICTTITRTLNFDRIMGIDLHYLPQ